MLDFKGFTCPIHTAKKDFFRDKNLPCADSCCRSNLGSPRNFLTLIVANVQQKADATTASPMYSIILASLKNLKQWKGLVGV